MPKLKLTYFDFHGGRGEPARLALFIGGVPFEDHRVPGAEWPKLKPTTPFGVMPLLEVDGRVVTQSNTINRYVGKLAGLYPTNPLQAALADEVMDAIEDFYGALGPSMMMKDEQAKKAAREALVAGPLPLYLRGVAALLENSGGQYFADGRLTVADLKVFCWVRHLRSGVLDHIAADLVERLTPALVQHHERVAHHPKVSEYYSARRA